MVVCCRILGASAKQQVVILVLKAHLQPVAPQPSGTATPVAAASSGARSGCLGGLRTPNHQAHTIDSQFPEKDHKNTQYPCATWFCHTFELRSRQGWRLFPRSPQDLMPHCTVAADFVLCVFVCSLHLGCRQCENTAAVLTRAHLPCW